MWGVFCLCCCGTPVFADSPPAYDLATCIALALETHPGVQAAEVDVDIAEVQLAQARAARILPKFDLTWIVGPSPEARGNALVGDSDWQGLSVFTRTEATLVQPLYTFGKLESAKVAAAAGVTLRQAGLQKAQEDLALQVAEAFYGLQLANELWELAQEAREDISEARDFVEEKLEAEEGDYTYTDLARIDRFVYDVEEQAHAAQKGRALAISGLRLLLGLTETDSLVLADRLRPVKVEILPPETYREQSQHRSDLAQLRAGIDARGALTRVAHSEYYPQVFLGAQFKYAYAPNRDDQDSPFAKDDFNFKQAGFIVGFKQSLSFGLTSAKVKKARLEHQKLRYQARLAQKGVALQVEKIYGTLREAQANLAAARKARRATRRWFISARDGFNAGLGEAKEMIDAVKEYGIIRAKYHLAVFNFNRAWARLQRATGNSILN